MASDPRIKKDDKRGTYYFRLRYKDKTTGEWDEKKRRGFRTKAEANAVLTQLEGELKKGFDRSSKETLEEFLWFWYYEYRYKKWAKNTYLIDMNNINNHILPYYQKIQLTEVTHESYQKFINHLLETKSKRTAEIVHTSFNLAMKAAIKLKKINENPCEGVEIRPNREKKNEKSERIRFIEYDEIPAFLDAAKKDDYLYYMFLAHLIQTGMRKGEAGALQWKHVDIENRKITIEQTMDYQTLDEDEYFGDPKTFNSRRVIPITSWWAMQLNAHRVRQNINRDRFGDDYKAHLDLVFAREDGDRIPKSTLFNAHKRICRKAGLSPDYDIHSTRHTATVLMLESEMDLKVVQEILGHGSARITSDIYTHISKRIENRSVEKFESHIAKIFGS